MSEKKCEHKDLGLLKKDEVVCNEGIEVNGISISDRLIEDHIIRSFHERNEILKKENRWTIDFQYGSKHFVVYFTEESAKNFREKVNESFSKSS